MFRLLMSSLSLDVLNSISRMKRWMFFTQASACLSVGTSGDACGCFCQVKSVFERGVQTDLLSAVWCSSSLTITGECHICQRVEMWRIKNIVCMILFLQLNTDKSVYIHTLSCYLLTRDSKHTSSIHVSSLLSDLKQI